MEAHWKKISFRPDTELNAEVDELPDLDIQVGYNRKENLVNPDTRLQCKYKSVIVKGFVPEISSVDAMKVISENGLPPNLSSDSVTRNDKTGVFTISNLVPDQCLEIMEKMHTKKFLTKKIFVTSVVASSPSKTQPKLSQITSDHSTSTNTAVASSPPEQTTLDNSASTTGNMVISETSANVSNIEILPQLASPVLDPRAASKSISGQMSSLKEFEFDPP